MSTENSSEETYEWHISPEEIPLLEELRKFVVGWAELCNELGIPAYNPEFEGISYWEYIKRELVLKRLRELEKIRSEGGDARSQSQTASQENSDKV